MSLGINFFTTQSVHDKVQDKIHHKAHDKVQDKFYDCYQDLCGNRSWVTGEPTSREPLTDRSLEGQAGNRFVSCRACVRAVPM